jgi:hypothetical protein
MPGPAGCQCRRGTYVYITPHDRDLEEVEIQAENRKCPRSAGTSMTRTERPNVRRVFAGERTSQSAIATSINNAASESTLAKAIREAATTLRPADPVITPSQPVTSTGMPVASQFQGMF